MNTKYWQDIDVLVVDKKEFYTDLDSTILVDDFVIDLDSDNNILGIEIIDASLKLSLNPEELSKVEDAVYNYWQEDGLSNVELYLKIEGETKYFSRQHLSKEEKTEG